MKIDGMNERQIENRFEHRVKERWGRQDYNGRRWVGLFLLIVGALFLARESGVLFPRWLFTWPMILIGFGLLSGIRHQFRGIGWMLPILIGSIFLIDKMLPELRIKPYLWPAILIVIGLFFIFRPKRHHWHAGGQGMELGEGDATDPASTTGPRSWQEATTDRADMIDATAIFGGIKKNVMSKNFKGGDITTFMGGAEINLLQADCHGRIMIDCFNMFGGTKLIVPADWEVQSGLMTIFGGIEDKRPPATQANPTKVLYLDGTCIFGGVEIKSF